MKRKKLPKIKTVRNKCDNMLTPLMKKMHDGCLLCGGLVQVGHHHIHKSKSTRLRYELDNIIPLCGGCHMKLHQNESLWGSKVTETMGFDWLHELERKGREIIKVDVHYYIAQLERLTDIYNKL